MEGDNAELKHKTLLTKIEKEFREEINEQNILPISYTDARNRQSKCYELKYEYALQLLMSESKTVRKGAGWLGAWSTQNVTTKISKRFRTFRNAN